MTSAPDSPPPAPPLLPLGLSRRAAAWLFHAPGLYLIHGERLSPRLLRANAVAAILTVAAIAAAAVLAPPSPPSLRLFAAIAAWLAGHVAWGSYLVRHLPPRSA